MTTPARVRPAIVLVVAAEHVPVVDSEFGRYARDYDILCADDADGGRELVRQALADEQPVALLGVGWAGARAWRWGSTSSTSCTPCSRPPAGSA